MIKNPWARCYLILILIISPVIDGCLREDISVTGGKQPFSPPPPLPQLSAPPVKYLNLWHDLLIDSLIPRLPGRIYALQPDLIQFSSIFGGVWCRIIYCVTRIIYVPLLVGSPGGVRPCSCDLNEY